MYRSAAAVMGQTQGIVEEIQRRVPGKRVELYPNGVDVRAYARPLDRAGARASFGWRDDTFVIGYAGVLGHAQALGQVLDAARLLADVPNVHFAFFGDGPCRGEIENRIEREKIVSACVYPRQPAARMPDLQAAFDAGLVPLARGKVFEGARPSKMFEILAAARPVILCGRGEARRIVEGPTNGPAGVSVDPEDPPALAVAIRRLMADRADATAMGERGRTYVFSTFDRERIARGVEKLLLATIEEGRS
jgi:glycosyltransferase involved in cell wall biosynthesis